MFIIRKFSCMTKGDVLNFHIVNFPCLSSNIPSGPSYGVCSLSDMPAAGYCNKLQVDRLLSQVYNVTQLRNYFQKFLVAKYQKSVKADFLFSQKPLAMS